VGFVRRPGGRHLARGDWVKALFARRPARAGQQNGPYHLGLAGRGNSRCERDDNLTAEGSGAPTVARARLK
jgi:hypothetical protein